MSHVGFGTSRTIVSDAARFQTVPEDYSFDQQS